MNTIENLHKTAIENSQSTYIDPKSGYKVFTSKELLKRPCCGNICRHCPYGHVKGCIVEIEEIIK